MSGTHGILKRTTLVLGLIAGLMIPGAPVMATAANPAPGDVASAGAQPAEVGAAATNPVTVSDAGTMGLYWVAGCTIPSQRTTLIFLRASGLCELGGEVGFAALITNTSTSHTIKVCNQHATLPFIEEVNPANPDGSATGQIIPYADQPGGGCYLRTVGYPIRKFRATFAGDASPWAAPY